jgi:hypothetical protein
MPDTNMVEMRSLNRDFCNSVKLVRRKARAFFDFSVAPKGKAYLLRRNQLPTQYMDVVLLDTKNDLVHDGVYPVNVAFSCFSRGE